MTTADLANLSEITYANQPSASTPLLINVVGDPFNGQIPNQAGIGGSQAPYILSNFPDGGDHQGRRRRLARGHYLRTARDLDLGADLEHRGERRRELLSTTATRGRPGARSERSTTSRSARSCRARPPRSAADRDAHPAEEGHRRRQRHRRAVGLDAERRGYDPDVRPGRAEVARGAQGEARPRHLRADRGRSRRVRQPRLVVRRWDLGRRPARARRRRRYHMDAHQRRPARARPATRASPWSSRW